MSSQEIRGASDGDEAGQLAADDPRGHGHRYDVVKIADSGFAILGDIYGNVTFRIQVVDASSEKPLVNKGRSQKTLPRRSTCARDRFQSSSHIVLEQLCADFEKLSIRAKKRKTSIAKEVVKNFAAQVYHVDVQCEQVENLPDVIAESRRLFRRLAGSKLQVPQQSSDPDTFSISEQVMRCISASFACSYIDTSYDPEANTDELGSLYNHVLNIRYQLNVGMYRSAVESCRVAMEDANWCLYPTSAHTVVNLLRIMLMLAWFRFWPILRILANNLRKCSMTQLGKLHPMTLLIHMYFQHLLRNKALILPWHFLNDHGKAYATLPARRNEDDGLSDGMSLLDAAADLADTNLDFNSTVRIREHQLELLSRLPVDTKIDWLRTKYNLAHAYIVTGKVDAAKEAFASVRHILYPGDNYHIERLRGRATIHLGDIACDEGDHDGAIALYNDALYISAQWEGEASINALAAFTNIVQMLTGANQERDIGSLRAQYPVTYQALIREGFLPEARGMNFNMPACDSCYERIMDDYYHCGICFNGEFDLCPDCRNRGTTCPDENHILRQRNSKRDIYER